MENKLTKTFPAKIETQISDKFSAAISDYQMELRQNWHSHEEFILAMVVRGNVREQVKCEDTLINAFDVGIKAPDIRHTDHFCPQGVRVIRLSLAPKFVIELKKQALLDEGWYWIKGSNSIRPFLRLGQLLLSKNVAIEDDVFEILASLLPPEESHDFTNSPKWLKQAKAELDETFTEGIRLSQLATQAGVHPVYFARKFQLFLGCSVGGYVRKLQFRKVQILLTSGKYNLAQIACEAGFSDQAHLTRILNDEFGITPANFRKLLQ